MFQSTMFSQALSLCGCCHASFEFYSLLGCEISFSPSPLPHSCSTSMVYKGNLIKSLQISGSTLQLIRLEHAGSHSTIQSNCLKQHTANFVQCNTAVQESYPRKKKKIGR